jgi:hypothetical protein
VADVKRSMEALRLVVRDFPFATDIDRSVWLANLFSVVGRPAVPGPIPMFAYNGNTAGVGKGLLTDVIGLIATGQKSYKRDMPHESAEQTKAFGTIARQARPYAVFDNIRHRLGGEILEMMLTTGRANGRILGKLEDFDQVATTVWAATGNNLQLRGDMNRRVLLCNLRSTLTNPDERQDYAQPGLDRWVLANRGPLLSHVLTVLRGYWAAGCPAPKLPLWDSYSDWHVIRSIVVWAGGVDPFGGVATKKEDINPEEGHVVNMLSALYELTRGGLFIVATLPLAPNDGESPPARFYQAAAALAPNGKVTPDAVGRIFRYRQNAWYGGFQLEPKGKNRNKITQWQITRM